MKDITSYNISRKLRSCHQNTLGFQVNLRHLMYVSFYLVTLNIKTYKKVKEPLLHHWVNMMLSHKVLHLGGLPANISKMDDPQFQTSFSNTVISEGKKKNNGC